MNKNILLVGNPNVGKSSIFNILTHSHEHTGNWTGKTVKLARKNIINTNYTLIDLPGIYSLSSLSDEEIVAKDTLLFEQYEKIIYVMDSSNIEKNLHLLLQILEINKNIILCLNMIDELDQKGIKVNDKKLSEILGIKVIKCSASKNIGIKELIKSLDEQSISNYNYVYDYYIEKNISDIFENLTNQFKSRFIALKLLEKDKTLVNSIKSRYKIDIIDKKIQSYLMNVNSEEISDSVSNLLNDISKNIFNEVVETSKEKEIGNIDKIFSKKIYALPIMFMIMFGIFFITIVLANYPSELLSLIFNKFEIFLTNLVNVLKIPSYIYEPIIYGIYRVVSFIVSVMFPPLVIFFFLFTYAEESGILPRLAFNFDKAFKCSGCHGKQALTICSGFGCNACAVVGSRIIDSKRDKLIAILTNSFIPCNGRFPMIIALITMFFTNSNNKLQVSLYLTLFVILAVLISLLTSFILSKTILKGYNGFFILELPDYKKVKFKKVLKNSLIYKSLSILKKAVLVSIPCGIIIYCMTNTTIGNLSLFKIASDFLNPFGKLLGLDGVILLSFFLALPANEIVLPIIIMGYLGDKNVPMISNYLSIKDVLINNNWTYMTALSTILFSIMHFPCGTTLATIKNEVGTKWMIYSFFIPLVTGILFLFILNLFQGI